SPGEYAHRFRHTLGTGLIVTPRPPCHAEDGWEHDHDSAWERKTDVPPRAPQRCAHRIPPRIGCPHRSPAVYWISHSGADAGSSGSHRRIDLIRRIGTCSSFVDTAARGRA